MERSRHNDAAIAGGDERGLTVGVARAQTAFVEEQVKQEVQAAVEATLAVRHSPAAPRARRAASPRCRAAKIAGNG